MFSHPNTLLLLESLQPNGGALGYLRCPTPGLESRLRGIREESSSDRNRWRSHLQRHGRDKAPSRDWNRSPSGWTKSILHLLTTPGMMTTLEIPASNGFPWFQSGAGFRPSTVLWGCLKIGDPDRCSFCFPLKPPKEGTVTDPHFLCWWRTPGKTRFGPYPHRRVSLAIVSRMPLSGW